MSRSTRRLAALALPSIAALGAACAASPGEEAKEPVIVSTDAEPAPSDNPDPKHTREQALEFAQNAGILGALSANAEGSALASLLGTDEALGTDALEARGALWGDSIGEAFGAGGLGLAGTGPGAGGTGEGSGLGSIGTIGHGAGTGTGQGYGSGVGRLGGSRKDPPTVRAGATAVTGSLPREVIQRIVRSRFARLRYCYEQGLATDPNLEGKVVVRFEIGKDGSVTSAQASGDLPDGAVVECVRKVFDEMSFPAPDPPGVVVVSYPVVFRPGDDGSKTPPPSRSQPPPQQAPPSAPPPEDGSSSP